jgi:ribosomal protein L3 glutamine methyltransferase
MFIMSSASLADQRGRRMVFVAGIVYFVGGSIGCGLAPGIDALAVARLNVKRHGLGDRIRLCQGDGLAAADGRYDLILCNPPYVNQTSMNHLPAEYRAEPALALAGGPDGMDFVRRLLGDVAAHLHPQAVLVLEIGHERQHFEAAFAQLLPLWLSTSAGDDQVLLLTREQLQ